MADSMIALVIISIGITTLLMCRQQLDFMNKQHVMKLNAARLAKEASDEYMLTGDTAEISRPGFQAIAANDQVVVYHQGKIVLKVTK
ncbi:MAG: hypothetical protein Q3959_03885 [Limosilactobacillus sp.]|uniref:hypothetical protein n=1 Tax=Limosilactobacillus sp. TaxID=2773925 RepID=UPI0027061920|nr:hypothetical protein [Limosilactobacillus sp.]